MASHIGRRDFLATLGGAAVWPLAARAQQPERMRRIGMLSNLAADDAEAQARNAAFLQALQQLGWTDGRNVQIDFRWGAGDADRNRRYAAELIALAPDVILATGSPAVEPLHRATHSVPIVFLQVTDPVGAGLVASLARPAANITGFTNYEYGMSGKWLELLKEIAPRVTRALVLRELNTAGIGQFAAIQAVAPSLGVEVRPADLRDVDETERAVAEFAHGSSGDRGLIVTGSGWAIVHRQLIVEIAARHMLPAIYPLSFFVPMEVCTRMEPIRSIHTGAPLDMSIASSRARSPRTFRCRRRRKYEIVINLKTAKALGSPFRQPCSRAPTR